MNRSISIAISVFLSLLVSIAGFWFNQTHVLAHRPHDDVYAVKLSGDYQQDQSVFMIVRGNLLKSTDGGITWQRLTAGIDNRGQMLNLTLARQNPQILYISARGDGIYKSIDKGESWFKVNRGLDNLQLDLLLTDSQGERVLAAGEEQGLYYSDNGGENFREAIAERKITALAFNSARSEELLVGDRQGELYVSLDGGQTWQQRAKIGKGSSIKAIAVSPQNQTLYVGTEEEGVWQSQDDGKTFTPMDEENAPVSIKDIVIGNDNRTLLVSERNQGVFALESEAEGWTKLSQGLTKDGQADEPNFQRPHFGDLAISPNFNEDKTLFLAGFNGLFKSTNGGNKWTELDALSARIVVGLAISPNYANDSTLAVVNYVGEAYITRDAGKTWQPMYKGMEIPRFTKSWQKPHDDPRRFFDIAFSSNYSEDGQIFLGTLRDYLLKSRDRGENWQLIHLPKSPGYIRGNMVLVSPNFAVDGTVFFATNRGHLYESRDEVNQFSFVGEVGKPISGIVISPNFAKDYTFYATSGEKIYKSVDGGQTWKNIIDKPDFKEFWLKLAISSQYSEDNTIFAGTDLHLYKSEDGGSIWRELPPANYGGGGIVETIAMSPNYLQDQTLFVSIKGKGAWKSTDGGESFTPVGKLDNYLLPFSHLNGVHSAPSTIQFSPAYSEDNTLYGFGLPQASIIRSTDGGETWQAIDIPPAAIFTDYKNNQYDLLTTISLHFLVYRVLFVKFILAATVGAIGYWITGKLKLDRLLLFNQIASFAICFALVLFILVKL